MIFSKLVSFMTSKKKETMKTATIKTELQEKCIDYISGKSTDQDFNSKIDELSKNLQISKYEVIEHMLDQQERCT